MVTLECFEQIKAVLPPVTKRSMRPSAFQGTKSFKLATESSSPGTQKDLQDSVEVGLSLDSGKMISGDCQSIMTLEK